MLTVVDYLPEGLLERPEQGLHRLAPLVEVATRSLAGRPQTLFGEREELLRAPLECLRREGFEGGLKLLTGLDEEVALLLDGSLSGREALFVGRRGALELAQDGLRAVELVLDLAPPRSFRPSGRLGRGQALQQRRAPTRRHQGGQESAQEGTQGEGADQPGGFG